MQHLPTMHPTFYIPQDVSRSDIIGCKDQSVECCGCAGEVTSHQCRGRSLASTEPASGTEQLLTNTPPPVRGQLGSARAAVQAIQPQKYLDSDKKYLWDTGDTRYMLIFILRSRSTLPTQQCHCIVQKTVITVNSIILMLLVTWELMFCYVMMLEFDWRKKTFKILTQLSLYTFTWRWVLFSQAAKKFVDRLFRYCLFWKWNNLSISCWELKFLNVIRKFHRQKNQQKN